MVTSHNTQYSYAATESEDVDPPPELVSLLRHGVDPGAPHGVQPGGYVDSRYYIVYMQ